MSSLPLGTVQALRPR